MNEPLDLQSNLNTRQRQAVMYTARPLLILAGPGTGKTRVLTVRAAWLVEQGHAEPEHVLAVTFTNKAAEEMRLRLETLLGGDLRGLWALTFHSLALRLLREYGPLAGLPADFTIFDEMAQREVLIQTCERMGWGTALPPRDLARLRDFISYRKAHGVAPGYTVDGDDAQAQEMAQAAQTYQDLLHEYHALDFDDLIVQAAQMLHDHEEIRATVQNRFRHVLVDEGHDMNPAQYSLLQHIAPPGSSLTIVADDDQSIYRWRGAEPRLIQHFRQDYQPQVIFLEETYRSTGQIVDAAQALIHQGRRQFPRSLRAMRMGGGPIQHVTFQRPADEERWLVDTIRRLVTDEGKRYGDIAILYRTHDLADTTESALIREQIPIHRIQRESFFEHPGVQEVLRYLQLLRSFTDPYLRQALNFPRQLVDELTMLQLRSLADREEISLAALSRQLDSYPEVSPLTRAAMRHFLHVLDAELLPLADQPIDVILNYLFKVLEQRRAPFHREELATLSGFAHLLPLTEEMARLKDAVDAGRPVALVAPRQLDALCAAMILRHALADTLNALVSLHAIDDGDAFPEHDGLTVLIGLPAPTDADGDFLTLTTQTRGDMTYSLSTVAWRLAASLLVGYEALADSRFVVYDIETTGLSPTQDDIIQVGALNIVGRTDVGPPFETLVRPRRGYISAEASKVHGLTWHDVKNAPEIDAVLPRLLRYFGDATLVGHNITQFDNRFLQRDIGRALPGRRLTNRTFDTVELARRLLPDQSHTLAALVQHYRIVQGQTHRALDDARLERDILFQLLDDDRWRKELLALSEMLPLVAIGMEASGAPLHDENGLLRQAAVRVARAAASSVWFDPVVDLLPESEWLDAQRFWTTLHEAEAPETAEDRRWLELRRVWQEQVQAFLATGPDPSLAAFLDYAALATNEDDLDEDAGHVTLMTLHNSKGKEFPVVIILGAEDGHIPDWRSMDDEDAVEEERRVFYVGMTRAMDRLYLTSVTSRADGRRRAPSRFIAQLPRQHIEHVQVRPAPSAPTDGGGSW